MNKNPLSPISPQSPQSHLSLRSKAGYEYLLAYKLTVPIYDYTVEFCRRFLYPSLPRSPQSPLWSRTIDQMTQAARSGMQNISEGYMQQGRKGYIKLVGVSRGSLEELLKDYLAYARQHKLSIFSREKSVGEIREIGGIWEVLRKTPVLPDHPNFPNLPDNPEQVVNLMITLIHQANYLLDKLVASIKYKHEREGGLTEELYRKRIAYRNTHP